MHAVDASYASGIDAAVGVGVGVGFGAGDGVVCAVAAALGVAFATGCDDDDPPPLALEGEPAPFESADALAICGCDGVAPPLQPNSMAVDMAKLVAIGRNVVTFFLAISRSHGSRRTYCPSDVAMRAS